jgi:hypothetical protein
MRSASPKLGQVLFRPNHVSALVGTQDCKIMRLLPPEDSHYPYRIKYTVENVERVAKEREFAP